LGYALSEKMVHVPEKKSAYIALSAEDLARFNYKKGYTEGLVNWGLSIEGVQMAILASEKDGCVKISFRSKGDKDVNVIAKEYFGGGGHKNAAGARSDKGYAPTVEILKEIIEKHG
jgi:phosphoesterase RecJ-like protein